MPINVLLHSLIVFVSPATGGANGCIVDAGGVDVAPMDACLVSFLQVAQEVSRVAIVSQQPQHAPFATRNSTLLDTKQIQSVGASQTLENPPLGFSTKGKVLVLEQTHHVGVRGDVKQAPGGDDVPEGSAKNFIIVYTLVWSVVGGCVVLGYLFMKHKHAKLAQGNPHSYSFEEYRAYIFSHWFVWTPYSKEMLLIGMCICYMLVGSALYCLFVKSKIVFALYQTFNMLVDPGGAQAQTTPAGQLLGVPASLGGLLIFAVLLAVVQDRFNAYLEDLKKGSSPVVERDHILVIGFTAHTMQLLHELCLGFENRGKTIVVLSQTDKTELEDLIQSEEELQLRGSKIVVRTGTAYNISDLKKVSADTCSTAILMPDRDQSAEVKDAFMMQTLIALCSKGWPIDGHVIVGCSLPRNKNLFQILGGPQTHVVMLQTFIAKILHRCSVQPGFGSIIHSLFGFQDSELHLSALPCDMVGKSFGEANKLFSKAVLLGVVPNDDEKEPVILCPGADYKFSGEEQLISIAEDDIHASHVEDKLYESSMWNSMPELSKEVVPSLSPRKTQTVVIFGWTDLVGFLLFEIESNVGPNSKVVICATKPVEERRAEVELAEKRLQKSFVNVTEIEHDVGELGSRAQMEELLAGPGKGASRIFVLGTEAMDPKSADALTITMLVQIRDSIKDWDVAPALVPQIRNNSTEALCVSLGLTNYVNSARIPAQIIANITLQPRIIPVLVDLLSEGGAVNSLLAKISDYLPIGQAAPTEVNFWNLMSLVQKSGDVLTGWTVHSESLAAAPYLTGDVAFQKPSETSSSTLGIRTFRAQSKRAHRDDTLTFEINPADRCQMRRWSEEDDRLIVIRSKPLTPDEFIGLL
jgi:hypothetical protein